MSRIDDEIEKTKIQIQELTEHLAVLRIDKAKENLAHRKTLKKAELMFGDTTVNLIVAFLRDNPGSDKRAISDFLLEVSDEELAHILTKARRNRGVIENRGTRAQPKWFAK